TPSSDPTAIKLRNDLATLKQQMNSFCRSIDVDLDSFRRNIPQYVNDLGKGIASGKALNHIPNEEFGALRLHELLATVRNEQDAFEAKERAARRLEKLTAQEEALKKEITALEASQSQQQQQQPHHQQSTSIMARLQARQ